MRTRLWTATLVLGLGALPMPAAGQLADSAAVAVAQRFVSLLQAGEWSRAGEMVAPPLRDRLGAAQLEALWGQISSSLGAGTVNRLRSVTDLDTMRSVELYGDFARDTVLFRIALSPSAAVMGFWVGALPETAPGPSHADESEIGLRGLSHAAYLSSSRRVRPSRARGDCSRGGCRAGRVLTACNDCMHSPRRAARA